MRRSLRFFFIILGVLCVLTGCGINNYSTIKETKNQIKENFTQTESITSPQNINGVIGGWLTESGTYYKFDKNNTYHWYKDKEDLEDNYYKGTLKILQGKEALEDLDITYDKVLHVIISSKGQVTIDDIYSLNLTPTYLISSGIDKTDTLTSEFVMKLLFVNVNDEVAQGYNFNTGDTYYFTRVE